MDRSKLPPGDLPATLPPGTQTADGHLIAIGTPHLNSAGDFYEGGWPIGFAAIRADLIDWSEVPSVPDSPKLSGVERIAAERARQVQKLGWTPEHDLEHDDGSLALVALCYTAQAADVRVFTQNVYAESVSFDDPWPQSWEGCDSRFYGEGNSFGNVLQDPPNDAFRIRLLEKAGALIAAEIDRMTRKDPAND